MYTLRYPVFEIFFTKNCSSILFPFWNFRAFVVVKMESADDQFSPKYHKTKTKPTTTNVNNEMNEEELEANTRNRCQGWKNVCDQIILVLHLIG